MAIRDAFKIRLLNDQEYVVQATKQGGQVELNDEDEDFFMIFERTSNGAIVHSFRIQRSAVESIEYVPGK